MTKDEMIAVLEMVTGYSREYLKSLTPEQVELLYRERVG